MKNTVVTRILIDGAVPEFQQHACTNALQDFRARSDGLYASIGQTDSGQREVILASAPGEAEALASMFTGYGLTCQLRPAPEFLDADGVVDEGAIYARLTTTPASCFAPVFDFPELSAGAREAAWA